MTLNRVDLPQPDGPITERNSPGLTVERDVVDRDDRAFRRLVAHDNVVHRQDGVALRVSWPAWRYSLLRVITAVMAAV